jgi:NTP pyrophosphatase (non-canonical NTP hydrolase)
MNLTANHIGSKEMSSYAELEMKVLQWSEARKIVPNSTPFAQSIKAVEEINELVDALRDGNRIEAIDAVGDTMVCLINVCALMDVNLTDCLEAAYHQIKDRRGYMNAEGIFVKEQ